MNPYKWKNGFHALVCPECTTPPRGLIDKWPHDDYNDIRYSCSYCQNTGLKAVPEIELAGEEGVVYED